MTFDKGLSPLAMSIDIGTSSSRVFLWDSEGREVGSVKAQIQYQMRTTPDGGVEMDPEELVQYVAECIDQAVSSPDSAALLRALPLCGVGISTFWHSMIGIDSEGKAVTPLLSWADNRSAAVSHRLRSEWDSAGLHSRTGCTIHPSYYPAKIVWLRESRPEIFKTVARWISPSEYLFARLFGKDAMRVSTSIASGTGLFHQTEQRWDQATLALVGIDESMLSPIAHLTDCASGLTPEFAARWPILKDVPFFPAVGDGACGNIGSGCNSPKKLAINLGTSGAIRAVWDESNSTDRNIVAPTGLWRYRVDSHRPIIGAAFSDGGHVYSWMSRTLRLPPPDQLEKEIGAMRPGAHGLKFYPYLAGERSMGWNPEARASLVGMNLDTNPVDIMRASMEAVALQFAAAADCLRELFPEAGQIVASGGALSQSPAWSRMFADAIGSPMTLAAEPEASSRGAALLALEMAGVIDTIDAAPARMGETILPDMDAHAAYRAMSAT